MSSTRFEPPVPSLEKVAPDGSTVVDPDGFIEPGENDYSSSKNKKTLRSYISSLTKGRVPEVGVVEYNGPVPTHANAYSIGDDSGSPDESYIADNNEILNYSNSGFFDGRGDDSLKSIINKGKSGRANGKETLSGHLLLRGVKGVGDTGDSSQGGEAYKRAIPTALGKTNISSPGSTHDITAGVVAVADGNSGLGRSPGPTSDRVSIEVLKNVAINSLLAASGKAPILGPDGQISTNLGAETQIGLKPSSVQEGLSRVNVETLAARNSTGVQELNLTTAGEASQLQSDDGVGETTYSNTSYGTSYNPLEKFSSITSAVTSFNLLAALSFGIITAIAGSLSAITKPADPPIFRKYKNLSEKKLKLGKFEFEKDEDSVLNTVLNTLGVETNALDAFGLYKPSNLGADYGQCVIAGFSSILGINQEYKTKPITLILSEIAARILVLSVSSEKGYYFNIFRGIVEQAGALPNDLTSFVASAGFIGTKIVRFVDTLARIGDMIFLQEEAKVYYEFNVSKENYKTLYKNGYNVEDAKTAKEFAKQRIKGATFGSTRGSALGVSELPSAHLIPTQYGLDKKLSSFTNQLDYGNKSLKLKQDDVARIENILESEYMPFYFHDLRTNEIISFHAFLEDLSDSYSANYNSTSGYGRIEDIKTYKDTKRSVGCTFQLVATNQDDFNYMWWQINKLTTMVYPQWSQGRNLTAQFDKDAQDQSLNGTANFNFTQPFSQIPTATPVIRVRVGDLIRSNYSRFNLKRIFGFKDPDKNQEVDTQIQADVVYAKAGTEGLVVGSGDAVSWDTVRLTTDTPAGPPSYINENPFDPSSGIRLLKIFSPELNGFIAVQESNPGVVKKNVATDKPVSSGSLLGQFYNPDGNSIIKSFESSMGLGLAAVVTQLQFTWMDGLWGAGEDGAGNRAPRSCKVQMSFEPIHDIAPGLDYQGLNRAPIYPVGSLVNSLVEYNEDEPYGRGRYKRKPTS